MMKHLPGNLVNNSTTKILREEYDEVKTIKNIDELNDYMESLTVDAINFRDKCQAIVDMMRDLNLSNNRLGIDIFTWDSKIAYFDENISKADAILDTIPFIKQFLCELIERLRFDDLRRGGERWVGIINERDSGNPWNVFTLIVSNPSQGEVCIGNVDCEYIHQKYGGSVKIRIYKYEFITGGDIKTKSIWNRLVNWNKY